ALREEDRAAVHCLGRLLDLRRIRSLGEPVLEGRDLPVVHVRAAHAADEDVLDAVGHVAHRAVPVERTVRVAEGAGAGGRTTICDNSGVFRCPAAHITYSSRRIDRARSTGKPAGGMTML